MPKIFVIIVTYKGHLWYDRCFTSLRESKIPVQTVVIDNASNDGTVEYIRENYPEIHLIASETNLGFGQGNNKGIRYALDNGADYVFLLNQDAWIVDKNLVEKLVEVTDRNKQFAIVSPLQLYGSGQSITNGIQQHFIDGQTQTSDLFSDLYFQRELNDIYEVPYVCAASWFITRAIIEKIGGFDPIFFHYGEDDNYLQRIEYNKLKIGICPTVSVCHDVEFREKNYGSQYNNWKKNLLLEYSNINNNINLINEVIKYLKKAIFQFLLFHYTKANYNFKIFTYILKQRNSINRSRETNKLSNKCWL